MDHAENASLNLIYGELALSHGEVFFIQAHCMKHESLCNETERSCDRDEEQQL